jgi:branched-chain amino acid transport system ATP-binding protein
VIILEVRRLTLAFGGLIALADLDLTLDQGEVVGLIGPNGAGKTTVFNLLTGVYVPDAGAVVFYDRTGTRGQNLVGLPPYRIARLGMARTFQNIRLFKDLSVLDNVKIACHFQVRYHLADALLRTARFYREEEALTQKALELLQFFQIETYAAAAAKNLPYGAQRKLEIVRALATNPHLLLLDEPAAGMNPRETRELMELIGFIRQRFNLTVLLIEHDMRLVMGICERVTVLDYGRTIATGAPDRVGSDPRVVKAFLGEELGADA